MQIGPEIKIEGKRPEWLKDDEKIGIVWKHGERWDNLNTPVDCVYGWEGSVVAIMLPVDHPYYLATEKDFTYWPGGESAPDDWDGGSVLLRSGDAEGYGAIWYHIGDETDIIGYSRKAKADAVYINPITRTEAYEDGLDIPTLEKLGLLMEETLLERFARENPYFSRDQLNVVRQFIEWQENNQ